MKEFSLEQPAQEILSPEEIEKLFLEQDTYNQSERERKKIKAYPNVDVPEKLKSGFPPNYKPWLSGWSFSNEELQEIKEVTRSDGKTKEEIYKMLTLDVSISKAKWAADANAIENPVLRNKFVKESYPCPNKCASCYERNADSDNKIITWEENVKIIDKACELGLKTVKFLGPGEVINDPDLFKYLDYFERKGLNFLIFTKPAILMDNNMSKTVFENATDAEKKPVNIKSSEDLCDKIKSYKCVRLLMNFMSADPETEKVMVDPEDEEFRATFTQKRNEAVEVFTRPGKNGEPGMNDDPFNQKLALICTPILKDKMVRVKDKEGNFIKKEDETYLLKFQKGNVDEAFDIFKWGVERNIPVVVAPTMVSGGCALSQEEVRDENFKEVKLVNLWSDIYEWLDEKKIKSLEDLEEEGVAPYAGFSCDQFMSGMFVRKDGRVQACPGNEDEPFRYHGNIAKGLEENDDLLLDTWIHNMGYEWRKNVIEAMKLGSRKREIGCPSKQSGIQCDANGVPLIQKGFGSFPEDFGGKVLTIAKKKREDRLEK